MEQQQRQTQRCHDQVNFFSDRSSTQSFTCATRLTSCKIHTHAIETKPRTHRCHRQVKFLSDRSSTQSFACASRLTDCKIHTHAIETKPRTPPPSDVSECLKVMNNDLRQCLKWMNSLQRSLIPLIQRCKQHLPTTEQQQRQTQRCHRQVKFLSDRSSM